MTHKALTVHAPFSWLIRTGRKRFEVRSKPTNYRGPLLICAGLKTLALEARVTDDELQEALDAPRGVATCLVDVVGCRPATPEDAGGACVEPAEGHYVWILDNPRPVAPQPVRGMMGFFRVDFEPVVVDANFEAWRNQYRTE